MAPRTGVKTRRSRADRHRPLQLAVAVCGIVPVGAGLAGVLLGPQVVDNMPSLNGALSLDSHFRYLSGILLGIGLAFWSLIPTLATRAGAFRLLTALVVAGGLGRVAGLALAGRPSRPMMFALVMELLVTPLLCLWQARLGTTKHREKARSAAAP